MRAPSSGIIVGLVIMFLGLSDFMGNFQMLAFNDILAQQME